MGLILVTMSTQVQIKVTIPQELKEFLDTKAMRLGLPVASYVRHIIIRDVEDIEYPIYQASKATERAYKQAFKEYKAGKTVKVKNLNKFFDEL
jgi:predicted DNA-binding protein